MEKRIQKNGKKKKIRKKGKIGERNLFIGQNIFYHEKENNVFVSMEKKMKKQISMTPRKYKKGLLNIDF